MENEKHVIARIKKEGKNFEILVDLDKAIDFKSGKKIDVSEVLAADNIFDDIKKGKHASEKDFMKLFKTEDEKEIAKIILQKGEIQLSTEYKNKKRDEKKKRIIDLIHKNTIDPKTGLPHPAQRIENAMAEAKVNIDFYKSAEEQIKDIIKSLRPIIPIKFEKREIQVKIPAQFITKSYNLVKNYGTMISEKYLNDGSYIAVLEIPSGMQEELFDKLNSATHGEVEVEILKVKE